MFGRNAVKLLSALLIFSGFLFFITPVSEAKLYRWTDSKGHVHFTDYPPPEVETPEPVKSPEPTAQPPSPKAAPAASKPTAEVTPKKDVKKSKPDAQKTDTVQSPAPAPTPAETVAASTPPSPEPEQPAATEAPKAETQQPEPQAPVVKKKKIPLMTGKVKEAPKSKIESFFSSLTGDKTQKAQQPKKPAAIFSKPPLYLLIVPVIIFLAALFFGYSLFRIAKMLEVPSPWIGLIPTVNYYMLVTVSSKPIWWIALLLFPLTLPYAFTASYMSLAENLGLERKAGLIHASSYVLLIIPLGGIVLLPSSSLTLIIISILFLAGNLVFFLTPEYLIWKSAQRRKQDEMERAVYADRTQPSEKKAWDDVSDMSTVDMPAAGAGLAASSAVFDNDLSYHDDTIAVYKDDTYEDKDAESPTVTPHSEEEETLTINKDELGFEVVDDDLSQADEQYDLSGGLDTKTDDEDYETVSGISLKQGESAEDEHDETVGMIPSDEEFRLDDDFKLHDEAGHEDFDISPELDIDLSGETSMEAGIEEEHKTLDIGGEMDLSSSLEIDLGDTPEGSKEPSGVTASQDEQFNFDKNEDFEIKDEDYDYSDDSTIVLDQDIDDFGIDIDDNARSQMSEQTREIIASFASKPDTKFAVDDEPTMKIPSDDIGLTSEEGGAADLDSIPDLELSLDDEPVLKAASDDIGLTSEEGGAADLDSIPDLELSLDDEPVLKAASDDIGLASEEGGTADLDSIPDLELSLDDEPVLKASSDDIGLTSEEGGAADLDSIPDLELSLDDEPVLKAASDDIGLTSEEGGAADLDSIPDLELALDDEPVLKAASDDIGLASEEGGAVDLDSIPDLELSLDDEPVLSDLAQDGNLTIADAGNLNLDDKAGLELALDDGIDIDLSEIQQDKTPMGDNLTAGFVPVTDEEETVVPVNFSLSDYDLSLNESTVEIINPDDEYIDESFNGIEINQEETLPDLSAQLDIAGSDDISTDEKPDSAEKPDKEHNGDAGVSGKNRGGKKPRG
ncbi:MAG: DUF4124 domain-containing protein [Nitrospirae bacterium YQR-1]